MTCRTLNLVLSSLFTYLPFPLHYKYLLELSSIKTTFHRIHVLGGHEQWLWEPKLKYAFVHPDSTYLKVRDNRGVGGCFLEKSRRRHRCREEGVNVLIEHSSHSWCPRRRTTCSLSGSECDPGNTVCGISGKHAFAVPNQPQ